MNSFCHSLQTVYGTVQIEVDVYRMDSIEAIDIWELPELAYGSGGYRVEGRINGIPRGQRFYPAGLASFPIEGDASESAREFLAAAHQDGFFSKKA